MLLTPTSMSTGSFWKQSKYFDTSFQCNASHSRPGAQTVGNAHRGEQMILNSLNQNRSVICDYLWFLSKTDWNVRDWSKTLKYVSTIKWGWTDWARTGTVCQSKFIKTLSCINCSYYYVIDCILVYKSAGTWSVQMTHKWLRRFYLSFDERSNCDIQIYVVTLPFEAVTFLHDFYFKKGIIGRHSHILKFFAGANTCTERQQWTWQCHVMKIAACGCFLLWGLQLAMLSLSVAARSRGVQFIWNP